VRPGVRLIVLAPATTRSDVVAALRAKVFACFTAPFDYREITGMARAALEADHCSTASRWCPACRTG